MKNVKNRLHEMIGKVVAFKIIFTKLIRFRFPPPRIGMETYSHKISIKRSWSRVGTMKIGLKISKGVF